MDISYGAIPLADYFYALKGHYLESGHRSVLLPVARLEVFAWL
jgi:hypothetical protein